MACCPTHSSMHGGNPLTSTQTHSHRLVELSALPPRRDHLVQATTLGKDVHHVSQVTPAPSGPLLPRIHLPSVLLETSTGYAFHLKIAGIYRLQPGNPQTLCGH